MLNSKIPTSAKSHVWSLGAIAFRVPRGQSKFMQCPLALWSFHPSLFPFSRFASQAAVRILETAHGTQVQSPSTSLETQHLQRDQLETCCQGPTPSWYQHVPAKTFAWPRWQRRADESPTTSNTWKRLVTPGGEQQKKNRTGKCSKNGNHMERACNPTNSMEATSSTFFFGPSYCLSMDSIGLNTYCNLDREETRMDWHSSCTRLCSGRQRESDQAMFLEITSWFPKRYVCSNLARLLRVPQQLRLEYSPNKKPFCWLFTMIWFNSFAGTTSKNVLAGPFPAPPK